MSKLGIQNPVTTNSMDYTYRVLVYFYRWWGWRFVCGSALGRQPFGRESVREHAQLSDVSVEQQEIFGTVSSGGQIEG